jgi:hypothetical protein
MIAELRNHAEKIEIMIFFDLNLIRHLGSSTLRHCIPDRLKHWVRIEDVPVLIVLQKIHRHKECEINKNSKKIEVSTAQSLYALDSPMARSTGEGIEPQCLRAITITLGAKSARSPKRALIDQSLSTPLIFTGSTG